MKREKLNRYVTLIEGDCLAALKPMRAATIGAVITDPPYGVKYQSGRRADTLARMIGDHEPAVAWCQHVGRLVIPEGCLLSFTEWRNAETFRTAIELAGFRVTAQLVWDRINQGMGNLTAQPAPRHDLIWFATHGPYQMPGPRPASVYRYLRMNGKDLLHPAQKPVELIRRLIVDYAPAARTILDPFAGSGTTGIAATLERRACILIEQDPAHCAVIRERFAALKRTINQ